MNITITHIMNKFVVFTVITGKEILYDHLKTKHKVKRRKYRLSIIYDNSDVKSDFLM